MDHSTISLQMGTNKCASQVGMTAPGMQQHIYDTKLGTDKYDNYSMSLQMGHTQGTRVARSLAWASRYATLSTARLSHRAVEKGSRPYPNACRAGVQWHDLGSLHLHLPDSRASPASVSQVAKTAVETRFHHGVKLVSNSWTQVIRPRRPPQLYCSICPTNYCTGTPTPRALLHEGLTLSPRLEYSDSIMTHCSLNLPRLRSSSHLSLPSSRHYSQEWQHATITPATQQAEAGESLEPRSWRLQWAKIAPPHSSLGDRVRSHLKKNKKQIVEAGSSGEWWLTPVILALCGAEAGRLPELRKFCSYCRGWSAMAQYQLTATSTSQVHEILLSQPPKPGHSQRRSPTGCQCNPFGWHGCFAGASARRLLVRSKLDWVSFWMMFGAL
ncbi:Calponin-2 [Plecturocebus cupreus]